MRRGEERGVEHDLVVLTDIILVVHHLELLLVKCAALSINKSSEDSSSLIISSTRSNLIGKYQGSYSTSIKSTTVT